MWKLLRRKKRPEVVLEGVPRMKSAAEWGMIARETRLSYEQLVESVRGEAALHVDKAPATTAPTC